MADTTILELNKLTTGSHSGTWGDLTNDNMSKIDTSIKGYTAVAVASTTQTLTTGSAGTGNQINTASFKFTGTLSGNSNIVCPAEPTWFFVDDATVRTVNNWTLTFKPSGGTGVALVNNAKHILYTDGSTMFDIGADMGNILANGTFTTASTVSMDTGSFTFNNSEGDYDARFAGDTETNLLFIDAGTDSVGINTNAPQADFDVEGSALFNDDAAETGGSAPQEKMLFIDGGNDKIGMGIAAGDAPTNARVEIKQKEGTGAIAPLSLSQSDTDQELIYFEATSAADDSASLSSSTATAGTKQGAIRVNINGTDRWIRFYDSAI